jgi:hypothetical protein
MRRIIADSAAAPGLTHQPMPSGAGHDAQDMANGANALCKRHWRSIAERWISLEVSSRSSLRIRFVGLETRSP